MNRAPAQRPGIGRRLGRLALFGFVQLALAVATLEVVGRIADPLGVSYYPKTAAYLDTLVREEPLGYRNRPGLEGRFWGAPVRINSLGLREREIETPAPNGEYRILVLGDSVPFGVGVSYEESIPHRLEELLNASHRGNARFRTINMGVPSYNTEQELIQLETLGLGLDPDAALLFFAPNDVQPKTWVLDKRANPLVDMAQRSYAASLLTILYYRARAALALPDGRIALEQFERDHPRWQAIASALGEIAATCRERGMPFVLFCELDPEEALLSLLQEAGRRGGFPVINLTPWEDPRWLAEDPRRFRNSATDSHPNAAGSMVFATLYYEGLQREGALPEGMPPEPVVPESWPESDE